jgi:hypothetical protein
MALSIIIGMLLLAQLNMVMKMSSAIEGSKQF